MRPRSLTALRSSSSGAPLRTYRLAFSRSATARDLALLEAREDDDLRIRGDPVDRGYRLQAVHLGHGEVQHDHVRLVLGYHADGLAAVGGLGNHHHAFVLLKRKPRELPELGHVVAYDY